MLTNSINVTETARGVSFAEIRASLRKIFTIAKGARDGGEFYRVDRSYASEYFRSHPDWLKKILAFCDELNARGIPLVYMDVCGRARWDKHRNIWNYNFSLQPADAFPYTRAYETRVEGNIFSVFDFAKMRRELEFNAHRPFLITCEPIAGLNLYIPSERNRISRAVVYGGLERRLREAVELLLPGGFIFIGRPIQGLDIEDFLSHVTQYEYASTLRIKELCKTLRCSVEIHPSIVGPYWLLRKHHNAK